MSTEMKRMDELVARLRETPLSANEQAELDALLLRRPESRRCFVDHMLLENDLREDEGVLLAEPPVTLAPVANRAAWLGWLKWRPLTAAAAGIVLGLFSASMVLAYVAPSLGKAVSLLQESFDSGPAPLVIGVPIEAGKWSGDFTEVVGEQQGVRPETGRKMLRFLRADYEGKVKPEGSYISEVYQLIDLRPYQREFADGGAVVQLSAAFNAFAFPAEEAFGCSVSLHAMDAEMALSGVTQMSDMFLTDCLAMARNNRMKVDRHPATWQRLSAELRLPPGAEYLLIRIGLEHSNKTQRRVNFDGHYLDDVRLTLARRAALP